MSFSTDVKSELEKYDRLKKVSRSSEKNFLRDMFLEAGTISDPNKDYRLDIVLHDKAASDRVLKMLNGFGLHAKLAGRRGAFVVYLKESEDIADFLGIIGAHNAMMDYENVIILKDVNNRVNREMNCENANIEKILDASFKQIENINIIKNSMGLEKLSPKLRETAFLRLENPSSSMEDLCMMFKERVSKPRLYHRFRKIEEIAGEVIKKRKK